MVWVLFAFFYLSLHLITALLLRTEWLYTQKQTSPPLFSCFFCLRTEKEREAKVHKHIPALAFLFSQRIVPLLSLLTCLLLASQPQRVWELGSARDFKPTPAAALSLVSFYVCFLIRTTKSDTKKESTPRTHTRNFVNLTRDFSFTQFAAKC